MFLPTIHASPWVTAPRYKSSSDRAAFQSSVPVRRSRQRTESASGAVKTTRPSAITGVQCFQQFWNESRLYSGTPTFGSTGPCGRSR